MKYGLFLAGLIAASTISTSHASNAEQVKSNFVISSYAKTKYPLLMVHGWLGWSRIGNLDNDGMVARYSTQITKRSMYA